MYIRNLLESLQIDVEKVDVSLYKKLIDNSIGFNPRNLKRAFNSLLLLTLVADSEKIFEKRINEAKKYELQTIIFACVCLQNAYEPLYHFMANKDNNLSDEFLNKLGDPNSYLSAGKKASMRSEEVENQTDEDNDNEFLQKIYR
jgi:hypothetical protein